MIGTHPSDQDVYTIIGAGWAGLACAVELCRHGKKVTVLDAAGSAGGRARTVKAKDMTIDNGQHLLLGAYKAFLSLLPVLSVNETDVLLRKRLTLHVSSLTGKQFKIKQNHFPGLTGQLWTLIQATGLTVSEKWHLSLFFMRLVRQQFKLPRDLPVMEYLLSQHQSRAVIEMFWSPLCVAALNTSPAIASAQVFLRVLQASFTGARHNSDLLFPKVPLGELFPEPAINYLLSQQQEVLLNTRIKSLRKKNIQWELSTNRQVFSSRRVIIATSFRHASKLLSTFAEYRTFSEQIDRLTTEPITTVYLQYPRECIIEDYMTGLSDGICQWYIDRRSCGQAGLMAAVISADGPHTALDKQSLIGKVIDEFSQLYPHWPSPLQTYLVREQHATFSCQTDIDNIRPSNSRLDDSLWVTGDYIDNGLPATLETAIQNGVQCAKDIIHNS